MPKALTLLAALAIASIPPSLYAALAARARGSCAAANGLHFICGPGGSEDIVALPDTHWLIASGLNLGRPAQFNLIDDRKKRAVAVTPGVQSQPTEGHRNCGGPPDLARMSTDGLGLGSGGNGGHRLYAANHGDRRAIEIFEVSSSRGVPSLRWSGCVRMPEGTLPNAVTPLRDGGFLATSFYDPGDAAAWKRMERQEPTGSLWEWHEERGFHQIGRGIAGANGLAISPDESTVYVSAWSAGKLLTIDRRTGARHELALGFLPDNIKPAEDGALLVTGQRTSVAKIAACAGPACPQNWIVARVWPKRGSITPILARPGSALVSYACTALQVGGTLYITARADRRIAYIPTASLPSLR